MGLGLGFGPPRVLALPRHALLRRLVGVTVGVRVRLVGGTVGVRVRLVGGTVRVRVRLVGVTVRVRVRAGVKVVVRRRLCAWLG